MAQLWVHMHKCLVIWDAVLTCLKAAMSASMARPLDDYMTSAAIYTAMYSAVHLHKLTYEPASQLESLHHMSTVHHLHPVQIYNLN